ncbi:unnamed protein product [Penicillium salamii]|nr:unnamed protein product [Penicillium salamii]
MRVGSLGSLWCLTIVESYSLSDFMYRQWSWNPLGLSLESYRYYSTSHSWNESALYGIGLGISTLEGQTFLRHEVNPRKLIDNDTAIYNLKMLYTLSSLSIRCAN